MCCYFLLKEIKYAGLAHAVFWPFHPQDLIRNSPYCLLYNSYVVNMENLVLDQLMIPWLMLFFILITCLLNIVLKLSEEILSWSLMELTLNCHEWPRQNFSLKYRYSSSQISDENKEKYQFGEN